VKFTPLHIGQLCDHGCIAVFTHHNVTVTLDGITMLTGTRPTATGGLWAINPVPIQINHHCTNSAIISSINKNYPMTPLIIASHFTMQAFSCQHYQHGVIPLMPTNSLHGQVSLQPRSGSTHLSPLRCTKAMWTNNDTMSNPISISIEDSHDTAPPEPPPTHSDYLDINCHTTTGILCTDPIRWVLTRSVSGN
jgi:hypothetical protein